MTSSVLSSSAGVLAYIPSPARGVWEIGPFPLRAYALFIIIGIVVAIFWGERRWMARGGEQGTVLDIAVWAVPFGLIGGRIYHVMTDWPSYFGEGKAPLDALKIWQGGLGIWGAVFFGGLGAWIGCRRRGIPLPAFGDAIAPPILLAQAIGRLGNYFNQELYGRETDVPWALQIFERKNANGVVDSLGGESTGVVLATVHPTFLYEIIWNLLVVVLLVLVDKRFKIGHGRLFALYVAAYCAGRFCIELMRADPASHIGGVRINSFTSAIVFVLAVAYVVFAKKGREEPSSLLSKKERERRAAAQVTRDDAAMDKVADDDAIAGNTARVIGTDSERQAAAKTASAVAVDVADGDDRPATASKKSKRPGFGAKLPLTKKTTDAGDQAKTDAATDDGADTADADQVGSTKTANVDAGTTDGTEAKAEVDTVKTGQAKDESATPVNSEAAEPNSTSTEGDETADSSKSDEIVDVAKTDGGTAEPAPATTDDEPSSASKESKPDDDVVIEKPLGSLLERNSRRMRSVWQRRGRR